MHINWQHLLTAIGLALVFEGMPYFLMPDKMPGMLLWLASRPTYALRRMGLAAMLGGLLLVYIAQS